MTEELDLDELRTVCVRMLDMLNRLEVLLMRFQHLAPAQDDLAGIRACRTTVREFLGKITTVEKGAKATP